MNIVSAVFELLYTERQADGMVKIYRKAGRWHGEDKSCIV
jgi:hypothetical protein